MSNNYKQVKEWRKHNKIKLVAAFGGYCACCKVEDHPIIYDFHHLDPNEKEATIARKIRSWSTIKSEAEKCIMLCAICHRKVHSGLIGVPEDALRFNEKLIEEAGLNKRTRKQFMKELTIS